MKFFLKSLIISFFFLFQITAFAKDTIISYKVYDSKNTFVGRAVMIYGDKGIITDYSGLRSLQVTENGETTITVKDFKIIIATGNNYWHRDGVGVMRNYVVQTSEGKRGMLYQTLHGTIGKSRIYNEKLYVEKVLVSETDTVIDEKDEIVEQKIKNDGSVQTLKRAI